MAGVRGIRMLGWRGAADQGEAEYRNPAEHVSQVSNHVDLFPEQQEWKGWISCENFLFLSADLREKLSVYTDSGPDTLRRADSIRNPGILDSRSQKQPPRRRPPINGYLRRLFPRFAPEHFSTASGKLLMGSPGCGPPRNGHFSSVDLSRRVFSVRRQSSFPACRKPFQRAGRMPGPH